MSVLIRLALRYVAGALVMKGIIGDGDATLFEEPELVQMIEVGVGLAASAMAEGAYYLAKKYGWNT